MTNREIRDRIELEARRRALLQAELHRPYWFDDSEPTPDDDGRGGPRMLSLAFAYCAVVVLIVGLLACRAWAIEDDLSAAKTADTVRQMEGK